MRYYVYWHPGNKVPKGTENPLTVDATMNRKYAPSEVKNTVTVLFPGMIDFIICDGKPTYDVEKKIFAGFQKAGQS